MTAPEPAATLELFPEELREYVLAAHRAVSALLANDVEQARRHAFEAHRALALEVKVAAAMLPFDAEARKFSPRGA